MSYRDGFIHSGTEKNMAAYRAMARRAGKVGREHGALGLQGVHRRDVRRASGPPSPGGELKAGEAVWFSFIVYKSRKTATACSRR